MSVFYQTKSIKLARTDGHWKKIKLNCLLYNIVTYMHVFLIVLIMFYFKRKEEVQRATTDNEPDKPDMKCSIEITASWSPEGF